MNAASQPSMPFAMTLGAGKKSAQGKYQPVAPSVNAVAEMIRTIPDGVEKWFSLHLWQRNYRTQENWLASTGVVMDADYDIPKVACPQNIVTQLLSLATDNDLPGAIFYLTPRGCRVIWVYERACSDLQLQRDAERGAAALLKRVLPRGLHIDSGTVGDTARFFFAPTCTAKGKHRQAEVLVMSEALTNPVDLAAYASQYEPSPDVEEESEPTPIATEYQKAAQKWNDDHAQDWPKNGDTCPFCGHRECFGRLPKAPERWFCWSANHGDIGVETEDGRGHHGDALDLEAFTRGVEPIDVLRVDGYLGAKKQESSTASTTQTTSGEVDRIELIDLGEALTEELIKQQQEPLDTGIPEVNERLGGGYFAGELIVLQASTGVGKTSYNLFSQCRGVADDPQRTGLYVTTEMQPHELQARRACQVLNEQGVICNWRDVLRGNVPLERTREATANTRIKVLRQRPSETAVSRIRLAALQLAEKHGKPPFIIADYLQALSLGLKEDRRIAVGTTIYDLQNLAVELRTPVVAISSISRAGNSKDTRESDDPMDFLNIAKEAGEIEFAAAVLIHLDVKPDSDEMGWRDARFILAKTRFGNLGITGLRFHGASGRFEASTASCLSEFDLEVLTKIHGGTFSSANAVAKSVNKNRPKVLTTVRRLLSRKVVINVGGYLAVEPKTLVQLSDKMG